MEEFFTIDDDGKMPKVTMRLFLKHMESLGFIYSVEVTDESEKSVHSFSNILLDSRKWCVSMFGNSYSDYNFSRDSMNKKMIFKILEPNSKWDCYWNVFIFKDQGDAVLFRLSR